MVSWRESRLILLFIALMISFTSVMAIIELAASGVQLISLANLKTLFLASPSTSTVRTYAELPVTQVMLDRAFPPTVMKNKPINPWI